MFGVGNNSRAVVLWTPKWKGDVDHIQEIEEIRSQTSGWWEQQKIFRRNKRSTWKATMYLFDVTRENELPRIKWNHSKKACPKAFLNESNTRRWREKPILEMSENYSLYCPLKKGNEGLSYTTVTQRYHPIIQWMTGRMRQWHRKQTLQNTEAYLKPTESCLATNILGGLVSTEHTQNRYINKQSSSSSCATNANKRS